MWDESAPHAYLASVESRLSADGCTTRRESWGGTPVLIGRRADFRLRWMATRLHLFTVAAVVPEITVPAIDGFTKGVLRYAKENKGGMPRGMQTGIAAFPVLVSDRVDPAAMRWAEEKQRVEFACMARPVVVDTAQHYVGFYRGIPFLGWVYAPYLNKKGVRYFHHDWAATSSGPADRIQESGTEG